MKLPDSEHTQWPWRIHEIAPEFRLEDVWELPVRCGRSDFPRLVETIMSFDPTRQGPLLVRGLFVARLRLGQLLGWDRPSTGVGGRVAALRDRLPSDLAAGPQGPASEMLPFRPIYMTGDEWAGEAANHTMHGVLHLGRVGDTVRLAVLVKPNGLRGELYMAAIKPFRYLLVYPALMREIERLWRAATPADATAVGP
jgi:hypothetical protein